VEGAARRRDRGIGAARPASAREILAEAARLADRGESFALATVVRRTPPSSARPGARALITRDGRMRGWLGGSCLDPVVRREAAEALREGEPRLVVFAPDPAAEERPGTRVHPMTCHSGGTVEIHVDPVRPEPTLELYGDSPVVRALAEMAPAAGFRVRVTEAAPADEAAGSSDGSGHGAGDAATAGGAGAGDGADRWAVVATMGEWDDDAVRRALDRGAAYVGLVASPRRAAELRGRLGLEDEDRLVSPAGLDLGAREPGEIAVTVLAEVIQRRRAGQATAERGTPDPAASAAADVPGATALDPVCGMEVEVEGARHRASHGGEEFLFCCAGCRQTFLRDPEAVLSSSA
jgi:xanthine dehydrogenase accessory factor